MKLAATTKPKTPKTIADLKPASYNPRTITSEAAAGLRVSLKKFGDISGLVFNSRSRNLVCGHQRLDALKTLYGDRLKLEGGAVITPAGERFPVRVVDWDLQTEQAGNIAANNPHVAGEFDEGLGSLLDELKIGDAELFEALRFEELVTYFIPGDGTSAGNLVKDFLIPPFSIFDAKRSYWKARRADWDSLGFDSLAGRAKNLLKISKKMLQACPMQGERTGVFDPTLCEIAYRWFCPPGGLILDPFAGGCVRGIVAAKLGYEYLGIDLRQEQIDANRKEAERLELAPNWMVGDSRDFARLVGEVRGDFIFSSPPYFNREHYSDLKNDLNNAVDYEAFLDGFFRAIKETVSVLHEHRFACFEVAETRDKSGKQLSLVSDTIRGFEVAGCSFYNHAIHLKPLASAALRARKMFQTMRKLVPVHEHVLVFVKGDPRKATAAVGPVEFGATETATESDSSP